MKTSKLYYNAIVNWTDPATGKRRSAEYVVEMPTKLEATKEARELFWLDEGYDVKMVTVNAVPAKRRDRRTLGSRAKKVK